MAPVGAGAFHTARRAPPRARGRAAVDLRAALARRVLGPVDVEGAVGPRQRLDVGAGEVAAAVLDGGTAEEILPGLGWRLGPRRVLVEGVRGAGEGAEEEERVLSGRHAVPTSSVAGAIDVPEVLHRHRRRELGPAHPRRLHAPKTSASCSRAPTGAAARVGGERRRRRRRAWRTLRRRRGAAAVAHDDARPGQRDDPSSSVARATAWRATEITARLSRAPPLRRRERRRARRRQRRLERHAAEHAALLGLNVDAPIAHLATTQTPRPHRRGARFEHERERQAHLRDERRRVFASPARASPRLATRARRRRMDASTRSPNRRRGACGGADDECRGWRGGGARRESTPCAILSEQVELDRFALSQRRAVMPAGRVSKVRRTSSTGRRTSYRPKMLSALLAARGR